MQCFSFKAAIASTVLFLLPTLVFSWNATGHMVIADIAYSRLDPVVKEKVDDLVDKMHQQYPYVYNFVDMATWADELRYQKIDVYSHWHYIDQAFSTDGSPLKNLIDSDNAVYAMKNLQLVIKNEKANVYERVRFLAFLEHVMGDLHQPLHTVSNITSLTPDGDKGGNIYYVNYNGHKTGLHYLWDSGLGIFSGEATPDNVRTVATKISSDYPEAYFGKRASDLSLDTIIKEGLDNAKQYVYSVPMNENISPQYVSTGQQVAEQQAALAGYRLAKLLTLLFS